MSDPDPEFTTQAAACGFCGAEQRGGRLLFSGRPRARSLGRPTPFVCSNCVGAARGRGRESTGSAPCTFCGRNAPWALQAGVTVLCIECADHCAELISASSAGAA